MNSLKIKYAWNVFKIRSRNVYLKILKFLIYEKMLVWCISFLRWMNIKLLHILKIFFSQHDMRVMWVPNGLHFDYSVCKEIFYYRLSKLNEYVNYFWLIFLIRMKI